MLPTSRLWEAFTAFKFKCTLRRHDCFLAAELPDSSRLPDCLTSWLASDSACNYCKLLGVIYTLSTHFRIFSFHHFAALPSFSAPARRSLPSSLRHCHLLICELFCVSFSFIFSFPLEAVLKMATAPLQLIKRIHNTFQIHREYVCYITLAWHRLQVLLQGQVWVAIKAHFKNNNAESFRSCASYITCECPLAPHRGRVCCESWHKYSNLWLRKGFTWASKQPSQAERLAWLPWYMVLCPLATRARCMT